jgi:hypothetical protein
MTLLSSWRISGALAILALLAAFAAWPAGPSRVEADVDSVIPDALVVSEGGTVDIDIAGSATTDGTVLQVDTSAGSLDEVACDDDADATCGAFTGPGASVNWAEVTGPYTATVQLTAPADCDPPVSITITATHDGDSTPVATILCVENVNDPDVVIEKQSDTNDEFDFDWSASSGDCVVSADDGTLEFDDDGTFDLEDNDNASFWCEASVRLFITEDDDFDFIGIDDCDEGDDGVDDISGSSVEFDISDIDPGDTVFCTWVNEEDFFFTPTAVVGQAASVSIILGSGVVDCGRATLVQVIPRSSSGGPAAAGTTIILTSSLGGTFQPSSTLTSAFPISLGNFLFTAPDDVDGVTTITARAGNVQTTAAVQIVCEVAPATSTAAPLAPPSAGDGGLLESSGTSYVPAALAIAAAAVVLGLTAATRRFAAVPAETSESRVPGAVTGMERPGGFALLVSFVMLVVALLARRWR